jgi:hypothetical protein
MNFQNRDSEEGDFQAELKTSNTAHDRTNSAFALAIMLSVTFIGLRKENLLLPYFFKFKVIDYGFHLFVHNYNSGSLYIKYRNLIVACTRLIRSSAIIVLLGRPSQEDISFPLSIEPHLTWSFATIWKLFFKSTLPLLQAFGYRMPMHLNVPLLIIPTAILSALSHRRCRVECDTNPIFYGSLYNSTTTSMSYYSSILLPTSLSKNTYVLDRMHCSEKCILTNSSILPFLGVAVPTLILSAFEEPLRMEFLQERGGTPIFSKSKTLLLYAFLLFPFLAAIIFEFVKGAMVLWLL